MSSAALPPADGGVMDVAADEVDFVPELSQLARMTPPAAAAVRTGGETAAPPAWLAVIAVAGALGLSLSLALPPATTVRGGAVTHRSTVDTADASTDAPPLPAERDAATASAWPDAGQ